MSKVKVSIIVPVYNVYKYLDRCLKSLVSQTLNDIEIIIINDGSPDDSQNIIDKYAKEYPKKIRAFEVENGGISEARNIGLSKATGSYIGFVDSDDYIEKDMYEKLYNLAEKEGLDIVIGGLYNVVEETGKKEPIIDKKISNDNDINVLLGTTAVWNKIYRKEVVENIKFRKRKWYEDLDYTVKAISNSKKIGYVDECFYNYMIRQGSIMNNKNLERNLEILDTFDEIKSYKKSNKYNDIIEYLAIYHIYICAVVRVINSSGSKKERIKCIHKLLEYIYTNYPNYKKNKYLYLLPKNKRIVYNLIKNKQYGLIRLIFRIKGR